MTIRIGNKEFSEDQVQALLDMGAIAAGAKHDVSSTTPNVAPPNGPFPGSTTQYGVFSTPGYRPGMWNATPRVRSFARAIPMFKSVNQNELLDVATGVTAGTGNNVVGACAVGPKPGQLKAMKLAATFGIIHESTKVFDITQAGMRRNRADVTQFAFNQARQENNWLPEVPGIGGEDAFSSVLRAEMYALGVHLERVISQVHFLGVAGTEDNAYSGIARQWNGLDQLIRTGWTDAVTGVAVPMADAAVTPFNAAIEDGVDSVGRSIVEAAIDTFYGQMDFLSGQLNIEPVFALVMRPDLFRALSAIWSCTYATSRCSSSEAGQPLLRDATSVHNAYMEYMSGMYLPMEGANVPVLLDDSIPRDTLGNNYFKSDVYGVMLTGNGRPTIYGEYFDMANPEAMEIEQAFGGASAMGTANSGMYRVFRRETGGCLEFDFYARPRLITDAPFAHFRIDDLFYRADHKQHDPTPGQSYYVNGGATYSL